MARFIVATFAVATAVLSCGGDASAQVLRGTDVGGLQPLRGYFSPHDWEHFDTKTGNLVITQVDLALPGNHGIDLVVQRTYNNEAIVTPSLPQQSWRWSIGLAGLVMRIGERPWPSTNTFSSLIGEIGNTPYFVMGDGSIKRTRYFYQYVAGTGQTATDSQRWVIAAGFLKYNRSERKLWMPDGRTCLYDTQGRLTSCTDAYGNGVSLSYTSTHIYVTQHLGASQQRQLTFELNGNADIVALDYLGRRWDYQRTGHNITKVTSPVGLEWQFGYSQGKLATVTLPTGGMVTYGYVDQHYDFGTPEDPAPVTLRVLETRSTNGPNGGTWTFDLEPGYSFTEQLAPVTTITTPSNTILRWENFSGSAGPFVMGGGTGFTTHTVLDDSEEWVATEQRQYTSLAMVSHAADGLAQIAQQVIWERDPATTHQRSRTVTYGYAQSGYYFHSYHHPHEIAEVSSDGTSRVVQQSFFHYQGPPALPQQAFSVGLKISEATTVNGQPTVSKMWGWSQTWRHPGNQQVNGRLTQFTPDAHGNLWKVQDPNNKVTEFGYTWGVMHHEQRPEVAYVVTRSINPDGTIASDTRGGLTTSFTYDDLGRLRTVQGPGGTQLIETTYDNTAASWVKTERGTVWTQTWLDGFGRPVEAVQSSGVRQRTGYDAEGRVTYQGQPYTPGAAAGNIDRGTSYTYDLLGRVLRETYADGKYTERAYALGPGGLPAMTLQEPWDDTSVRWTSHTYGPFGLAQLTDPASHTWAYDYDNWGRLTSIAGPVGSPTSAVRTWTYDNDTLASETSPEAGTITYDDYYPNGQLKQKTDARGTVFLYTYDDNNRLKTVNAGGLVTQIFYETGSDRIDYTVSGGVVTEYEYDTAGRPKMRRDIVDNKTFTVEYLYDTHDRLTRITYESGRQVGYAYDAHGRLSRVFDVATNLDYASSFVYHGSGAMVGFTAGNGQVMSVTLDDERYRVTDLSDGPLSLGYQYHPDGNVKRITDGRGAGMQQAFEYDALNRLQNATGFYGSIDYVFDAHSNRQTGPLGPTYAYHGNNPFRLLSIGGAGNYQYDDNGNMISSAWSTWTYRPDNRLSSASYGVTTAEFDYDAEAARVKKAVAGGLTSYFSRGPDGVLLTEWTNTWPSTATARDYLFVGSRMLGVVTRTDLAPK